MTLVMALIALGSAGAASDALGAGIEIRPTQLSMQVNSGTVVRRTVQLRIGDELPSLQAQPMELVYDKGGRALPVSHIKVTPPSIGRTGPGQTVSFTIEITLDGVEAGEYSGDLPFTYPGGEVKLPMKVWIRHRPYFPLCVLLLGIAAGIGLSIYRAKGRPRDQVLVRVGLVRAFLTRDRTMAQGILPVYQSSGVGGMPAQSGAAGDRRDDAPPLLNPFKTRIEATLLDVEMSLQSERWDEARQKMEQSEALLRKWIQGRLGWIQQLAYLARLAEHLAERDGHGRFLQSLRTSVADLIANAPMQDSPQTLRDAAQALADRIDDYERAESRLRLLTELRGRLPADGTGDWKTRIDTFRSELDNLRPDDKALGDLLAEIDKAAGELSAHLASAQGDTPDGSVGILRSAAALGESHATVEPVPEAHLGWPPDGADAEHDGGAQTRLRWFLYSSYGIALVLLAGTGFNEVYAKKLTFGADLWADYLTLLIWGFGAEATRDSVTSTLRGWGVPVDGKGGGPPGA